MQKKLNTIDFSAEAAVKKNLMILRPRDFKTTSQCQWRRKKVLKMNTQKCLELLENQKQRQKKLNSFLQKHQRQKKFYNFDNQIF